jgi:ribosomal protein L37E
MSRQQRQQRQRDLKPYVLARDNRPKSFVCPRCGMESFHPVDVREGYCGNCHDWTGRR